MPACPYCRQETTPGTACTQGTVTIQAMQHWRVRFGDERPTPSAEEHCPRCRVPRGSPHHAACPVEQCPVHLKPFSGCDCLGSAAATEAGSSAVVGAMLAATKSPLTPPPDDAQEEEGAPTLRERFAPHQRSLQQFALVLGVGLVAAIVMWVVNYVLGEGSKDRRRRAALPSPAAVVAAPRERPPAS